METCFAIAIMNHNVKTTGQSNDKFFSFLICMPPPGFSARDVVNPKYPFNIKRYVIQTFNKSKITPGVGNFWKLKNMWAGHLNYANLCKKGSSYLVKMKLPHEKNIFSAANTIISNTCRYKGIKQKRL